MKPKSNFVVEVKKSRRLDGKRKKHSLWFGVDLQEAEREERDVFEPAPARSDAQSRRTNPAAPEATRPPCILPAVTEPTIPDVGMVPSETKDALPIEADDRPQIVHSDEQRARHSRWQPRLRHWRQKSLPPGQRWKYRLPKVLQKPD